MASAEGNGNGNDNDNSILFMFGRFQPFTLGHLALLNKMLEKASGKEQRIAYLFVSHKKAAGSRSKLGELETALAKNKDMSKIKELMKSERSIMEYPLSASQRVKLVLTLLGKIYGKKIEANSSGETIIELDSVFDLERRRGLKSLGLKKGNSVELHVIDSSKVHGTAGFNSHKWLKDRYGEAKKVQMVTGDNRTKTKPGEKLYLPQKIIDNGFVSLPRNETNSTDDDHYTKLSGSKIRSWSVMLTKPGNEEYIGKIRDAYYSLLTEEEVLDLIVNPINESIFSAPSRSMSTSSSRRISGSVRPFSKNTRKKESIVPARSNRKAASQLNTTNTRRRNSRVRTNRRT